MNMPSKQEIAAYWSVHGPSESLLNFDWEEADISCWNCGGETSRLERAHIIPKSAGGSNSADNLVILCKSCHREAPDVLFKSAMWDWIKSNNMPIGKGRKFLNIWRAVAKLNGSLKFSEVLITPSTDVQNLDPGFLGWYKQNRGDYTPHGNELNEESIYAYMKKYISEKP